MAGPLTPPAGPVVATMKVLTDVEPRTAINAANTPGDASSLFKITQPGSYYLTGNVTGVAGKSGIEITTSGSVTLDLNGFNLVGAPGGGLSYGIVSTNLWLTIMNGSIRGWTGDGIHISLGGVHCGIEGVHTSNNAGTGIYSSGPCMIINSSALENGESGFVVASMSTVTGCMARGNNGDGILNQGSGVTVSNCTTAENGRFGILVGAGSSVINCSAVSNGDTGILTSSSCILAQCAARSNAGDGIQSADDCTITACTADDNVLIGIHAGEGNAITNCSAASNDSTGINTSRDCAITGCTAARNDVRGINTGIGCLVVNCTSSGNLASTGIQVAFDSSVIDCVSSYNAGDGIVASVQCLVRGNTCDSNGNGGIGAGINITNFRNRVEGNYCSGSDFGIVAAGPQNVIIRNTCAANVTNWNIVANNVVGPILDRTAPASAAIIGNSAPDSTGSTHPNANFTH